MAAVTEAALNFGPSGSFVGILSRPTQPGPESSGLAVVILNAGVIHRVGPNRLHVGLARRLAREGTPAFRIDLPGVGDSGPVVPGGTLIEDALAGVTAAFDVLQRYEVADRFVLCGLCSGADHAFLASREEPRVVGVVLIDPTTVFSTFKSHLFRASRLAGRPTAWVRLARGEYDVTGLVRSWWRLRRGSGPEGERVLPEGIPDDLKGFLADGFRRLAGRGVRILYLITGSERRYVYPKQLFDALPGVGLEPITRVETFPEATHTFSSVAHREEAQSMIADWVAEEPFGRSSPDPSVVGATREAPPYPGSV